MTEKPAKDFGMRRPALQAPPPAKRSHHVALLLMGTMAVGGGAYAMLPKHSCEPGIAPSPGQPGIQCSQSSSGSGGGHSSSGGWSRTSFFSGDSSNHSSATGTPSGTGGTVTRGGFGSFAAHFSGGG